MAPRKINGSTALPEAQPLSRRILEIPVSQITPDPNQSFDPAALDPLTRSIETRGLPQPVVVQRTAGDRYILVAGERRFRACRKAGVASILAVVTGGDPLEVAIIENLQREDLGAIEEAEALQSLAEKSRSTHQCLARIVGKSRVAVTESLALLSLPESIRRECRMSDIASKSQLLQIARERDPRRQAALWTALRNHALTVRDARRARQESPHARSRSSVRRIELPALDASVTVSVRRSHASEEEMAEALRRALARLDSGVDGAGGDPPRQEDRLHPLSA